MFDIKRTTIAGVDIFLFDDGTVTHLLDTEDIKGLIAKLQGLIA